VGKNLVALFIGGWEMAKTKVLLIEDEELDTEIFFFQFKNKDNFHIIPANCLNKGFELILEHKPDIIISDLGLPESDGLNTVKELIKFAPEIPLIIFTGNSNNELANQAIDYGAQDYIKKQDIKGVDLPKVIQFAKHRHKITYDLKKTKEELEFLNENLSLEVEKRTEKEKSNLSIKADLLNNFAKKVQPPLTSINGAIIQLEHQFLPGEIQSYIHTIKKSGKKMVEMFEGLMDLSLIQTNQVNNAESHFLLYDLLDKLKDYAQNYDHINKPELEFDFNNVSNTNIKGNSIYTFKLFKHLIKNAYETPNCEQITIECVPIISRETKLTNLNQTPFEIRVANSGDPLNKVSTFASFEDFIDGKKGTTNFDDSQIDIHIARIIANKLSMPLTYHYNPVIGNVFSNKLIPKES